MMNNMNSNHEQYELNMKGFFEDWCDLTWYWTWLFLLMIIFMSFCLWSRSCCRVCWCCWSTSKRKLQEFEFHWMNSTSSVSSLFFDLNICIHILKYEFDLENYFIHGVHSFILPMTCKNIALACNTTLDDGGREVYNLYFSNKHVNHYRNCLENKSKYDRQT